MLSRRTFIALSTRALPLGAAALAGLVTTSVSRARATSDSPGLPFTPHGQIDPKLGRVTLFGADVFIEPSPRSDRVRKARRDEVLTILAEVKGEAIGPHNDVWYQIDDGYVYSSLVQPVKDVQNDPIPELSKATPWGELTVPVSQSRWTPAGDARPASKLYYGGVFRVISSLQDDAGVWWYQLGAGVSHGAGPWIRASDLRRFSVEELSPLSPEVADKRIEIHIGDQTLTAFESGEPVLFTRVATGKGKNFTPRGSYRVWRKAIGQRMIGGEGSDAYDLPGVPFPTYFTYRGIATHGAYWHNDFGVVRSHGCINMQSDLARWIWRWTTPTVSPSAIDVRFGNTGTPVIVR
jgi:hypothetical protein